MSILKFEDLPCNLTEFDIEKSVIDKLELNRYEYFHGDYEAWGFDCDCVNEKSVQRIFVLMSGDVFMGRDDVEGWIKSFSGAQEVKLIQHKTKQFDINKISTSMMDPYFFAEVYY